MRFRFLAIATVGLLLQSRLAAGQLPGESLFSNKGDFRAEYLAKVAREVQESLRAWSGAVNQSDLKLSRSYVLPDLFFGPIEGWLARGPEALDSLDVYLPRITGYSLTVLDFDASGAMGYVHAAVRYQFLTPAGRTYRDVEATLVLLQRRDAWKIRSYVERPRGDELGN